MSLFIDRIPKNIVQVMLEDDYSTEVMLSKVKLVYSDKVPCLYIYPEHNCKAELWVNARHQLKIEVESALLSGCALLHGAVHLRYTYNDKTRYLGWWMAKLLGDSSLALETPTDYYRSLDEYDLERDN